MNIHHLELFYYVARHGGISRAVRHMPYGIQQPAVSSQMSQLEKDLGVRLFERKPFRLTSHGEEVYGYVRPFFEGLHGLATKLRSRSVPLLRVGGAEFVLRDYMPAIIKQLKARHADLQFGLRGGFSPELEQWLAEGAIDLAIMPLENALPAGFSALPLVKRSLALLVPRKSKLKKASELWEQKSIEMPLIRLPLSEPITRCFLSELKRRKVNWPLVIEASSVNLIAEYVANDHGIGLAVNVPEMAKLAKVRILPLDDFPSISVAAVWRGEPSVLIQQVLDLAKVIVAERWKHDAVPLSPERKDHASVL